MKRRTKADEALALIAGSRDGITEALLGVHGIKGAVLDKLVAARKVRVEESVLAKPAGLKVRRYHAVTP